MSAILAKQVDPITLEVQDLLVRALTAHPTHPGLTHLYIHLMEMSPTPERCIDACDVLRTTYGDMGHLLHMPSHIDMQIGNYHAAVECNRRACAADLKLAVRTGHHTNYHGYLCHNFHMLTWAAMFDGQFTVALQAAKDTYAHTPPEMLRDFAEYLEPYAAGEWHVLIRFGKWDDILAKTLPPAADAPMGSPVARVRCRRCNRCCRQ